MWKIILGIVGLVGGLPCGWLVGSISFFLLADHYRTNWFHGDDGLSWIIPAVLVLGPVLGGSFGVLLGAVLDRRRARRHSGGVSAEAGAAERGG